jgi:uncharacterized cupredoxin-like copper-binding protein
VRVTTTDFKLAVSTMDVAAGNVTFEVINDGPSTHEFNVDRTDQAVEALPIDSTGLFVAEDSPLLQRKGSIESQGLGTHHKLTLALAPGSYILYCNLEAHYQSGMRALINVH